MPVPDETKETGDDRPVPARGVSGAPDRPAATRRGRPLDRPRRRIAVVVAGGALVLTAGLAVAQQLPTWLVAPQFADEVAGGIVGAAVAWGAYRLRRRAKARRDGPPHAA
jgi:hypothetical protein